MLNPNDFHTLLLRVFTINMPLLLFITNGFINSFILIKVFYLMIVLIIVFSPRFVNTPLLLCSIKFNN